MYIGLTDNPAEAAADWVCTRWADHLPDCSQLTLVPADTALVRPLRDALLDSARAAGHDALLGPRIQPIQEWILERTDTAAPSALPIAARELMLFEALADGRGIVAANDRWQLVTSLLGLFEELSRERVGMPETADEFARRIAPGYGVLNPEGSAPLSREARLVHTLWSAWREQLEQEQRSDPADALREALDRALTGLDPTEFILWIDPQRPARIEADWFNALQAHGQAEVILRGHRGMPGEAELLQTATLLNQPAPPEPPEKADWTDQALAGNDASLQQRAAECTAPAPSGWHLAVASDAEQEARAVVLAAVDAVHGGADRVVIATEDRRLARRVRALLERFGLSLADEAGWALSTSRAAAVVERWLEALEQDYDHRPLLDVLKSPFLRQAQPDPDAFDRTVYRFEQDLIRHEGIPRDLAAWHDALRQRARRLSHWSGIQRREVHELLDHLDRAGQPLRALMREGQRPVIDFPETLAHSLALLGLDHALLADEAGARVMAVLDELHTAAAERDVHLHWRDFRTWLGRALEQAQFRPATGRGPVILADLQRAAHLACDQLIMAGTDEAHLPGQPPRTPFFNDGVRTELGLPTWEQHWTAGLLRFRRALAGARRVLFTRIAEQDGEPIPPAPWLDLLARFHQLAFDRALHDGGLLQRTGAFDRAHDTILPGAAERPAPRLPAGMLPERISASAHRDLIGCPYRFFAGNGLHLAPLEEVREEMQKADFGELVHRALEAFWQPVEGMPPPWEKPLDGAHRDAAIAHLRDQIDAAFAGPSAHHFAHRAWHRRAQRLVPAFIDWAITRAEAGYRFESAEQRLEERRSDNGPVLRGRLDRIDRAPAGHRAVIDYKTGGHISRTDIESGEDVQLVTYALIDPEVAEAAYLQLDADRVKSTGLDPETLGPLRAAVGQRLADVWAALRAGEPMPAWENAGCAWCRFEGLCRRPLWSGGDMQPDGQSSA